MHISTIQGAFSTQQNRRWLRLRDLIFGGKAPKQKHFIRISYPYSFFANGMFARVSFIALLILGYPYVGGVNADSYFCGTPHLSNPKYVIDATNGPQQVLALGNRTAPALPVAPALPIGTERTFFAPDFRSMQQYTVSAVLRGVGSFCYVFVEEAEWNTRVTARTVQAIIRAFDTATPANPQQGIYPTLTKFFGAPPDIDGNGRIILLLLNIQDAHGANRYTAGFFNPADQQRGLLRNPGFRGFPIRSTKQRYYTLIRNL